MFQEENSESESESSDLEEEEEDDFVRQKDDKSTLMTEKLN